MSLALRRTISLIGLLLLSGCIMSRSYVDPTFPNTAASAFRARAEPYRWVLGVQFLRQGHRAKRAENLLWLASERALRVAGIIIVEEDDSTATGAIYVRVNNTNKAGAAFFKGLVTGLSFGLVGSHVIDEYVMDVVVENPVRKVQKSDIHHSLHTVLGFKRVPPEADVEALDECFNSLIEQMLLKTLKEMQDRGDLTYHPAARRWQAGGALSPVLVLQRSEAVMRAY